MNRIPQIRPAFVDFIPETLDEGVLYISLRYKTASHLCCCGCGQKVVTPLNPAKWQLSEFAGGAVSLTPSIGNWSFPCKSHYWVDRNQVRWAGAMSPAQIAAVQVKDRHDAELLARESAGLLVVLRGFFSGIWRGLVGKIQGWWQR